MGKRGRIDPQTMNKKNIRQQAFPLEVFPNVSDRPKLEICSSENFLSGPICGSHPPLDSSFKKTEEVDEMSSSWMEAAGSMPGSASLSGPPNADSGRVASFLRNHLAHNLLRNTSSGDGTIPALGVSGPTAIYDSVMLDFAKTQMDRQAAGIVDQSERIEEGTRLDLIVDENRAALHHATVHAARATETAGAPLTTDDLREWHGIMGTRFPAPAEVTSDIEQVVFGLNAMWGQHLQGEGVEEVGMGAVVTLAAAALAATVILHPYGDGNGRVARILANWCLRLHGIPFVVNFHSTAVQRIEYTIALQEVQSRLQKNSQCPLQPFTDLVSNRIAHAADEFHRRLAEKEAAASDTALEKAVIASRKRLACSDCIICLDVTPDVTTLCCGQAVHLNCIAEWLSTSTSCVWCRGPLPRMRPRLERQVDSYQPLQSLQPHMDYVSTIEESDDYEGENVMISSNMPQMSEGDISHLNEQGNSSEESNTAATVSGATWFTERVHVILKNDGSTGIIRKINIDQTAVVEVSAERPAVTVHVSEVQSVEPKVDDVVLVTTGSGIGVEGELVCIVGQEAVVKDSANELGILPLGDLAKIELDA